MNFSRSKIMTCAIELTCFNIRLVNRVTQNVGIWNGVVGYNHPIRWGGSNIISYSRE